MTWIKPENILLPQIIMLISNEVVRHLQRHRQLKISRSACFTLHAY